MIRNCLKGALEKKSKGLALTDLSLTPPPVWQMPYFCIFLPFPKWLSMFQKLLSLVFPKKGWINSYYRYSEMYRTIKMLYHGTIINLLLLGTRTSLSLGLITFSLGTIGLSLSMGNMCISIFPGTRVFYCPSNKGNTDRLFYLLVEK